MHIMQRMSRTLIDRPALRVVWSHNRPDDFLGRFGGGWQWKVGAQASTITRRSGCVIVDLLVASLRITWNRKAASRA